MSRLWDTPEFWARSEADEALREMPGIEPDTMANSLEKSAASYDGDPEMVALIVSDLRRRAIAGIRFWPGPHALDDRAIESELIDDRRQNDQPSIAELIVDEIPW